MKKTKHVLFTPTDEHNFSFEIRKFFPNVVFIDGQRWDTSTPPAKESISECNDSLVYIWNKDIYPELPVEQREQGDFQGPIAGLVLQWERPKFKDEILLSGSLSTGITVERPETETMLRFAKKVWSILRKRTAKKLLEVNLKTGEVMGVPTDIWVGDDAFNWCSEKDERFFKFNNNIHIYLKPKLR